MELTETRFLSRPSRFTVHARTARGGVVAAHLADPGRLRELLVPEARLWLRPAPAASSTRSSGAPRRTRWTAAIIEAPGGTLVSLDTTLPNRLVEEALRARRLPEFHGWSLVRREVTEGASRFDFLLADNAGHPLLLEVKSVTLVEAGVALFPDAVTARGTRHLEELAAFVRSGRGEAAVLFLVQRDDARVVRSAAHIDPRFAAALAAAEAAGVRLRARGCRVTLDGVRIGRVGRVLSG